MIRKRQKKDTKKSLINLKIIFYGLKTDFCWSLERDCVAVCHRRKSSKRKLLPH